MDNLKHIQHQFQTQLLGGDSKFIDMIANTNSLLDPQARIDIYADGYVARLIEALTANYPMLYKYMGPDKFKHIAQKYITTHPSHSRSIRWFGNQLSEFLHKRKSPIMAELALFEWMINDTFDAKDAKILTVDQLRKILPDKWPVMKFTLHPSFRLHYFNYTTATLWSELFSQQQPNKVTKLKIPQAVIFWRLHLETLFRAITPMEAFALDAVLKRKNFTAICDGLCEWVSEESAAEHAAALIMQWLSNGLLVKINS